MSTRVLSLLGLVAELTDEERNEFQERLDDMFAPSPAAWERDWNSELSRRMAEVEAGSAQLVDGDEVLRELEADLAT